MDIREILCKNEFRFKKSLGQNFIIEESLLHAIVEDAGITNEDVVLEIGTGAGTLTRALSEKAARVISFDIDSSLQPILKETLAEHENVQVIFRDIMKLSDDDILSFTNGAFKIVANIPYNITTPLIMRFIESKLPLISATFMVQQEIAERLKASPGMREYGSITLSLGLKAEVTILRKVNRHVFYPVPKVDSAVIHMVVNNDKYAYKDEKTLKRLIRSGFHMRRKTFVNNIVASFTELQKETVIKLLSDLGFKEDIRGEDLSIAEYILIADAIFLLIGSIDKDCSEECALYEDDMYFEEECGSSSEDSNENQTQIDIIDYEK